MLKMCFNYSPRILLDKKDCSTAWGFWSSAKGQYIGVHLIGNRTFNQLLIYLLAIGFKEVTK